MLLLSYCLCHLCLLPKERLFQDRNSLRLLVLCLHQRLHILLPHHYLCCHPPMRYTSSGCIHSVSVPLLCPSQHTNIGFLCLHGVNFHNFQRILGDLRLLLVNLYCCLHRLLNLCFLRL